MELLSPAGGMIQAKSAVISGADAVYLGAESFSARSNANNFSRDELEEIVDFCHLRGVRVHLAVNTLIRNNEMNEAETLIRFAREIGIDAFIVQDLGLVRRIRAIAPDVPIHASTQMTVCSLEGVKMAEKMGLSRVVLARELSLSEITEITQNTDLEIEVFVHGAICVSYSGQCLLSSMLGKRSGNRGNCAQPCRKKYCYREREGYFLSPADMCHISHLSELSAAGVASVKIEGRMKSAEYVSTVTRIYRKYLDHPAPISDEDMRILKNVFCRGDSFTDGYLTGQTGASMMRPDTANDDILLKRDASMLKEHSLIYRDGQEREMLRISGTFSGRIGECARLSVKDSHGQRAVTQSTKTVEEAQNAPLSAEDIASKLSKLGGTPFAWSDLKIDWDGGFLPVHEINEMRRNALHALSEEIILSQKRTPLTAFSPRDERRLYSHRESFSLAAIVTSPEQALALSDTSVKTVFLPLREYEKCRSIPGKKLGIYLPLNLSGEEWKEAEEILSRDQPDSILCKNLSHIHLANTLGIPAIGSFQLNLYNTQALYEAHSLGLSESILSVELNRAQIQNILKDAPIPVYVLGYGKLPLMTTKNCLIRCATGGCSCDAPVLITDQSHTKLMLSKGEHCQTVAYNHTPIYMADQMDDITTVCNGAFLLFFDETPEKCREIAREYGGEKESSLPKEYTRGHFHRGV